MKGKWKGQKKGKGTIKRKRAEKEGTAKAEERAQRGQRERAQRGHREMAHEQDRDTGQGAEKQVWGTGQGRRPGQKSMVDEQDMEASHAKRYFI